MKHNSQIMNHQAGIAVRRVSPTYFLQKISRVKLKLTWNTLGVAFGALLVGMTVWSVMTIVHWLYGA